MGYNGNDHIIVKLDNQELAAQLAETTEVVSDGKIKLFNTKGPKPLVSFIDDDGYTEVITKLKPLFDQKGIKGSLAIISSYVGNSGFMTASNIQTLQSEGWEILSHTVTHRDLATLSETEMQTELTDSLSKLTEWGLDVQSIAYPMGSSNPSIRNAVKKHYRSGFATGGHPNNLPIDTARLSRTMTGSYFDSPTGNTLEYYKSKVDEVIANKAWVVFCTHVFATDSTQMGYLSQLIDYIQSKNVEIVTINKALDYFENIFESRDEDTGAFTIIPKNGKLYSSTLLKDKFVTSKPNGTTHVSTVYTFEPDAVTVQSFLYSDNSGFPHDAGTLLTYRPHIEAEVGLSYQQWIPYGINKLYQRLWNPALDNWSTLVPFGGETIKIESVDARTPLEYMWVYDTGKITYTPISAAHAVLHGFPEGKAGMLVTDKVYYEEGYQRQTYRLFGEAKSYERTTDANGNWGVFL